jgi:hypothetical protein
MAITPKIKISQMNVADTLNATDYLTIVQNGTNLKSTLTNFLKNLNSNDSIRINPLQISIDFSVGALNDPFALFVDGSVSNIGIGTALPQSKLHVNGNVQVGSASTDGVVVNSTESISYSATDQTNSIITPLAPTRTSSYITCATGVIGQFSLSAGSNGQLKTIILNSADSGKYALISVTGLGFNTIKLNATGSSVILQYSTINSKWTVMSVGNGAVVLSTV